MSHAVTSPVASRDLAAIARLRIVPRRFYGRWVAAALIIAVLAWIIAAFVKGDIAWPVVGQFFTAPAILSGLGNTLIMTVCAMTLGIVLGVVFAIMYMSPNPVLRSVALFYIWFFRGTPLLLQLLIWFNLALVFPTIGIPGLFSWRTIDIIGPFMATLLGLGMNQGAYTAEVVRGGILSVDTGQTEAAKAIGMTRLTALRRIVLPQAMRVIVPPTGNETIAMLKDTALLAYVPVTNELFFQLQAVGSRTFQVFPMLVAACLWYLVMTSVLMVGQFLLERHFARGVQGRAQERLYIASVVRGAALE